MNPPAIARTATDVVEESRRLARFRLAYAALQKALPPDGGPLGDEACGAQTALAWILGEGPALSDMFEDILRWGVKEALRPRASKEGGSA